MGGVRPNASENRQISPRPPFGLPRGDGGCPNLASILPEGRKTANIQASSGVIRGIPDHFNLTVELPLKALIRGYNFAMVPISWHNRKHGISKLRIQEMGSRECPGRC